VDDDDPRIQLSRTKARMNQGGMKAVVVGDERVRVGSTRVQLKKLERSTVKPPRQQHLIGQVLTLNPGTDPGP